MDLFTWFCGMYIVETYKLCTNDQFNLKKKRKLQLWYKVMYFTEIRAFILATKAIIKVMQTIHELAAV